MEPSNKKPRKIQYTGRPIIFIQNLHRISHWWLHRFIRRSIIANNHPDHCGNNVCIVHIPSVIYYHLHCPYYCGVPANQLFSYLHKFCYCQTNIKHINNAQSQKHSTDNDTGQALYVLS